MTESPVVWIVLAGIGLVGSAVCSGLEMGFYSLNRIRLDVRAGRSPPERRAVILRGETSRPDRVLGTLLIGNNLFNYFGVLGVTALLEMAGHSDAAIILLNALVLTPLLLVFGESLPKELFRVEADRLVYRFARGLRAARWVLTGIGALPLVLLFGRGAARLLRAPPEDALYSDARRRIGAMLKEGAAVGALSEAQSGLVDRALALRNATVGQRMVPWEAAAAVREATPRGELARQLARTNFSRVPVLGRDGKLLGVLAQVDFFLEPHRPVSELVKPPARLSPEQSVREALQELRQSRCPMAVVFRNGKPVGLATAKDLVEPLTGRLAAW
jgi:putative hemolysin